MAHVGGRGLRPHTRHLALGLQLRQQLLPEPLFALAARSGVEHGCRLRSTEGRWGAAGRRSEDLGAPRRASVREAFSAEFLVI